MRLPVIPEKAAIPKTQQYNSKRTGARKWAFEDTTLARFGGLQPPGPKADSSAKSIGSFLPDWPFGGRPASANERTMIGTAQSW
jgi:hypothetical protein